jgi:hypothetical protein
LRWRTANQAILVSMPSAFGASIIKWELLPLSLRKLKQALHFSAAAP